MKKIIGLLFLVIFATSCNTATGKDGYTLPTSNGNTNKIMVVVKALDWEGKIGNKIRTIFGEHQVGLPQPETLLSVSQIDPSGFGSFMRHSKAVLMIKQGEKESITVEKNRYAKPQIIIHATAKDKAGVLNMLDKRGKEIIKLFKDEDVKFTQKIFKKERIDETGFKTVKNIGFTIDIPKRFRLVEDSGDFIWFRQHLRSGIARGDGTNNVLIYTIPLGDENKVADNITAVRDTIGKKHIPGSKKGMYMITEQAYTPFTFDAIIDGKKAYETRGKWEVKNDFMAGPFINYTIIDKKNNRLVVFEGFTYAPSVNKRDFLFELEAIAKSMKIK
ncbi:DUF4837 family protein [Tenacibaculum finnmarkense]|uniref:DUF4837 family protein n=1 Tax=Tenacibaculum finnmarkense TaxID=2781243 RepID=UPI00187B5339|nr:DUF4837 family protein [Tenacibaculum finnmarkense]MBE7645107.1 DUF4837 family protein [Tenacibaculum finnmarkense genomovar ulcerans]MCG8733105.1 DUF4837 family protein [Tenacibaculum finnmarkense]MCG8807261.1 DUF4837 family protein [Tenacibaculum finnmarkense]MCG8817502.1 DUF4837 family protein [Tenacibaculum finnmarkense]MCG8857897.1 DUF4837 family protein [Tenacibaculum finnmarkense]